MPLVRIEELKRDKLEQCVDLFIDTFSKEPWNDVYESREQVVAFFENHFNNNYFLGYIGFVNDELIALSIGMKKPWIKGMEYYIDEFCVKFACQGKGYGGQFMKAIEKDIIQKSLNACILITEKGFPSEKFYIKQGFEVKESLVILAK